ncbi:unnamed protein product [Arctia plantaginis]|uniref:Uncharacterized protein n=1 Tax=Arctia plantaginis TaxID=874455 RepID=A0A8S0YR54_ARCPL|nr:unnamed protein product [Arctia plantaginis]CAB3261465.1 unnamed protein product [Arctia plantaginis]
MTSIGRKGIIVDLEDHVRFKIDLNATLIIDSHSLSRTDFSILAPKYNLDGSSVVNVSEIALQKALKPPVCAAGGLAGGLPLARSMARYARRCAAVGGALPPRHVRALALHKPRCLPAARSHLSVVATFWHHMQPKTITLNNYRSTILSPLNADSD